MMYEVDQKSLKKLGVPESFEKLFNDVFKGDDGGIYRLVEGKMHLLAKHAQVFPLKRRRIKLPKPIADLKEKLAPFSASAPKLYGNYPTIRSPFAFVLDNQDTGQVQVFQNVTQGFEQYETVDIYANKSVLLCGKNMLIKKANTYLCSDLPFVYNAAAYGIFWVKRYELCTIMHPTGKAIFSPIGTFKKLTQTKVNNLIEVIPPHLHDTRLYHVGRFFQEIVTTSLPESIKISEETGEVKANVVKNDLFSIPEWHLYYIDKYL